MANVIVNDTNLTNIANAIREKNGGVTLYKPSEMANAILAIEGGGGGGYVPTDEELRYDLNDSKPFQGGANAWIVRDFGNRIVFTNCETTTYMFSCYPYESFAVNPIIDYGWVGLANLFDANGNNSYALKSITGSFKNSSNWNEIMFNKVNNMFYYCTHLREINDNFLDPNVFKFSWRSGSANCRMSGAFNNCVSLREIPDFFFKILTTNGNPKINNASYGLYYEMVSYCCALNKVENIPIVEMGDGNNITRNMFNSTFASCYNLGKITFETNADGTAKVAPWKKQQIDLCSGFFGYVNNSNASAMTNYNSGLKNAITTVTDGTPQYYATKEGENTYFSMSEECAKFGRTEAVELINSLPNTMAAGGGNELWLPSKYQGKYTDYLKGRTNDITYDSSINTLTEAEIAVATAKGWTVTIH